MAPRPGVWPGGRAAGGAPIAPAGLEIPASCLAVVETQYALTVELTDLLTAYLRSRYGGVDDTAWFSRWSQPADLHLTVLRRFAQPLLPVEMQAKLRRRTGPAPWRLHRVLCTADEFDAVASGMFGSLRVSPGTLWALCVELYPQRPTGWLEVFDLVSTDPTVRPTSRALTHRRRVAELLDRQYLDADGWQLAAEMLTTRLSERPTGPGPQAVTIAALVENVACSVRRLLR